MRSVHPKWRHPNRLCQNTDLLILHSTASSETTVLSFGTLPIAYLSVLPSSPRTEELKARSIPRRHSPRVKCMLTANVYLSVLCLRAWYCHFTCVLPALMEQKGPGTQTGRVVSQGRTARTRQSGDSSPGRLPGALLLTSAVLSLPTRQPNPTFAVTRVLL